MFNLNQEIETTLANLGLPVSFMFYEGNADAYITYMQTEKDSTLAGENEILGCVQYYDFDIYSKGNYLSIINNLIQALTSVGWTYQPSRDSADIYDRDTKFFHKTICMAKESEV